ncbi:MAG: GIY-YIG nuclease family protein [Candidatus Marinimicrobia bacterium]|jgi:putative endonuclease|nr:GIY-YIG nuclease family protein [Candidatus Neomarinimicrobiota bacterium]MBT3254547.1 GIY-YIG nuclease family protein [Candidatus Neomarinimicrobiota bacterium]MBT4252952.1 GIY-YIG nuclease family protein [Candidatus Neomarinimicrobiota bacterium]MBT6721569.1 GIY-YIG nuclease family protein [Candidatus Neomarinimicrobiota bacterium]
MNYTLYILKSLSTGRLYIGQTNNFARRLKQHQDDRSFSTKGRGPWEVFKTIQFESRSEAMRFEVKLKKMKNPARIIAYVQRHYH